MGKVFVKGPVESPDDLLKIESQLARASRVGVDFGLGAAKRFLGPQPKDFGSFMQQYFFDPIQYLREGRGKRQLTDEEMDEMRFRRKQKFREQLEAERRPIMQEQKRKIEDAALLGRFQNLAQRTGADIIGLDKYKDKQDLSEFQEFANMNYPGMPLNEVANMLGQQFTNVEGRNLRNILSGKPAIEGYAPEDRANQMIAVSDAAATGEAPPEVNIDNLLNPPPPNKELDILTDTERKYAY